MAEENNIIYELSHTASQPQYLSGEAERGLPPGDLLVQSVEMVSNIAEAVTSGKPVTRRLVTCLGELKKPSVVLARVGMSLRELIRLCGGPTAEKYRVMVGGALRAALEIDLDTPVTKTTDAVIVLPKDHPFVEARSRDPETVVRRLMAACSGCGFCTELCPVHLMGYGLSPHRVIREVLYGQISGQGGLPEILSQALLCSECGFCELLACSKGLSPRELNRLIKRKTGDSSETRAALLLESPPAEDLEKRSPVELARGRKTPVERILQLLHLDDYADQRIQYRETGEVGQVELSLGEPAAVPLVAEGQLVQEGELIAEESAAGARIHASLQGRVRLVDRRRIVIVGQVG
jgi:Na+-translocating ferredoxin:NAD+ oxidoreductase RnfC subunit